MRERNTRARVSASSAAAAAAPGEGVLTAGPHGREFWDLASRRRRRRREPLKRSTHRAPCLSLDRHVRGEGKVRYVVLPTKNCLGVHLVRERSAADAMNADRGVRPLVTSTSVSELIEKERTVARFRLAWRAEMHEDDGKRKFNGKARSFFHRDSAAVEHGHWDGYFFLR